jgi:hypothetical protein
LPVTLPAATRVLPSSFLSLPLTSSLLIKFHYKRSTSKILLNICDCYLAPTISRCFKESLVSLNLSNKYDFFTFTKKLGSSFWCCYQCFACCYSLRPDASRTTIMMMAMTSSTHMMAPRLNTKPRSHSKTRIAATTKRKSSAPILKNLTYP